MPAKLDTIGKGARALAPAPRRLYLAWLGGFLYGFGAGFQLQEES